MSLSPCRSLMLVAMLLAVPLLVTRAHRDRSLEEDDDDASGGGFAEEQSLQGDGAIKKGEQEEAMADDHASGGGSVEEQSLQGDGAITRGEKEEAMADDHASGGGSAEEQSLQGDGAIKKGETEDSSSSYSGPDGNDGGDKPVLIQKAESQGEHVFSDWTDRGFTQGKRTFKSYNSGESSHSYSSNQGKQFSTSTSKSSSTRQGGQTSIPTIPLSKIKFAGGNLGSNQNGMAFGRKFSAGMTTDQRFGTTRQFTNSGIQGATNQAWSAGLRGDDRPTNWKPSSQQKGKRTLSSYNSGGHTFTTQRIFGGQSSRSHTFKLTRDLQKEVEHESIKAETKTNADISKALKRFQGAGKKVIAMNRFNSQGGPRRYGDSTMTSRNYGDFGVPEDFSDDKFKNPYVTSRGKKTITTKEIHKVNGVVVKDESHHTITEINNGQFQRQVTRAIIKERRDSGGDPEEMSVKEKCVNEGQLQNCAVELRLYRCKREEEDEEWICFCMLQETFVEMKKDEGAFQTELAKWVTTQGDGGDQEMLYNIDGLQTKDCSMFADPEWDKRLQKDVMEKVQEEANKAEVQEMGNCDE